MSKHLYQHIETLWQYMQMKHELVAADIIMVFCSNDLRVAEYAAHLYQQKSGSLPSFLWRTRAFY